MKSALQALPDRRAGRWRLRAAAAAIALCFATPAAALGLGTPELASHLGQPLALRVPLTSEDGGDLGPQCLRLVNQPEGDLPGLGAARLSLERGAGGTWLRITSLQPVHEPALRIALEVGCNPRVRKEFTVLLDPPPIAVAPPAAAVEFGTPQVLGARGQPLLVTVPILAAPPLAPECVRAARSDSADTPRVLNDARVALIDRDGRRALRLHTPDPVHDERVRVIVELGCEQPLRREFALLLEAPRLAASAPAAAARIEHVPPRRQPKPAPRPKAPAAPPVVAAAAQETPSETAPPTRPADAPQPARPAPAAIDRLVLAAPEDERTPPARPATAEPDVLRQIEVLSAEVRQLRAELEAANRRYRELEARRDTTGYAWAAGLAAVLLFGVGLLLGRRPRAETERAQADSAGPLTRILGQPQAERRAAAAPVAPLAEAAAAQAPEPAPRTDATAIQVTEIGDTAQVIGELYATFVAPPPTQPAPQTKTEIALDLDLGQERTSMLAPQTKTEIAVDIDLGERETEIARRIEREHERIAHGRANPDPSTPAGHTTLPMTRGLELDLDLPPTAAPRPESDDGRA